MGGFVADGAVPENVRRAEAIALIRAESDDLATIERICRAAVRGLVVSGAVVTLATQDAGIAGASDERALRVADAEFATGEGPSTVVLRSQRPLLAPDVRADTVPPWPVYAPAVHELGVVGVFAFPLHVGAVRLGVLTLLRDEPAPMGREQLSLALTFAELATETLLDGDITVDGEQPVLDLNALLDAHAEVYQAQGMIMVQLGIDLADALAQLRARAFVQGRDLVDLARDVLVGRERFDGDGEDGSGG